MQTDSDQRIGDAGHRRRRPPLLLGALIVLAVVAGFAIALRQLVVSTPAPAPATISLAPTAAPPARPAADAPLAAPVPPDASTAADLQPIAPPLPTLDDSDAEVRAALGDILPPATQGGLQPEQLLRRAAALIDGFAHGKLLRDKIPLPAISGKLPVRTEGERIVLDDANFTRYDAVVDALVDTDSDALARWFARYEPLLQQAWGELGTTGTSVRGAIIAGLDTLLAAPDVQGEIELVQPAVFYKYADPALEALPDTAKLMIRIGPRNRALLRDEARRLRDALAP